MFNSLISVKIKGFKSDKRNALINFSTENSTTIYGPNGCGKTTLLKILGAIFSKNEKILLEEKVSQIDIVFCKNGEKREGTIKKKRKNLAEVNDFYIWKGLEDLPDKYIYITTDRGLNAYRREITIDEIVNFFRNKGENYSLSNMSSLQDVREFVSQMNQFSIKYDINKILESYQLSIENITMDAIKDLFIYFYKEYEETVLKIQNSMMSKIISIISLSESDMKDKRVSTSEVENLKKELDFYRKGIREMLKMGKDKDRKDTLYDFFGRIEELFDLEYELFLIESSTISLKKQNMLILSSIIQIYRENVENINVINEIKAAFHKLISSKKKLVVTRTDVYIQIGKETHELKQLSNGERHLLTFLAVLGFCGKDKDFIMIDEPGISMDTDWQEMLVSIIESLCPNIQIIMTTHSPDISTENPEMITRMEIKGE